MAVSSANTTLSYSPDGTTYTKLLDITDYPDLGAAPNKIDTTDLSQTVMKTFVLGLQESPDLNFGANFDKTVYATIAALNASYHFKLEFGTAGADGAFTWQGKISIFANGAGVDESRKMTVALSAETPIIPFVTS